ncbi:LolA family protein [Swingsia samuiensis]|uniref:Outer membrane lipoprotein carrier protein LolA n=1 Tax=Swingsia samuiensis TaxID=1293412 RepID=A0A4Y6UH14_9PROT|nr:outer membrane lipoprotein carrier protein LolA [Swingsia samuiensis]QDH16170.1 outer membrane lipoprotein carrier protein LolA [Swingsia samuiensis]
MKRALVVFCVLLSGCEVSGYKNLPPNEQAEVQRVEAYLNNIKGMRASFVQIGPDAGHSAGRFSYVPGYLRLDYIEPHPMELVAGNGRLVFKDMANQSITHLSLKRNPLGLLVHYPIRFGGQILVTDARKGQDSLQVSVAEANNPSQGLLTLQFADRAGHLNLIGLQGVDVRKNRFSVTLSDEEEGSDIPKSEFKFPSE